MLIHNIHIVYIYIYLWNSFVMLIYFPPIRKKRRYIQCTKNISLKTFFLQIEKFSVLFFSFQMSAFVKSQEIKLYVILNMHFDCVWCVWCFEMFMLILISFFINWIVTYKRGTYCSWNLFNFIFILFFSFSMERRKCESFVRDESNKKDALFETKLLHFTM